MLPKIVVLALGGTIAMTKNQGDAGVQPSLTAADLVAAVPGLAGVADIEARSFRNVPSTQLTLDDMVALAGEIEQAVAGGAQGVVITQGTDTI
ncbi:MAG TPA: asparaginase domain-containing protein, partial [Sphingobacteriaceae bacterium]|nr:asparaginase domain-containing protein [Sphingobacteriaceae bacterium]